MREHRILLVVLTFCSLSGCKESFEPKGTYRENVVMYAILTTLSDTQYVRIYKTYNLSGFNPLEVTTDNAVVGAQVSITDNSKLYQFHDTTIVRDDKSRYTTDIKAYVAYGFAIGKGKTYSLSVKLDQGQVYKTDITVPADATLRNDNFVSLQNPNFFPDDADIDLKSFLSAQTQGFIIHTYIDFDLRVNGVWTPQREEIPIGIRNLIDCKNYDSVYPQLQRRSASQPELVLYQVSSYKTTLKKIWNSHVKQDVRLKQVVFELTQFDPNLYNYYSVTNGFRDQFSIRTDEPDFSNISGGHGVFGAMTRQILSVTIPDTTGISLPCK